MAAQVGADFADPQAGVAVGLHEGGLVEVRKRHERNRERATVVQRRLVVVGQPHGPGVEKLAIVELADLRRIADFLFGDPAPHGPIAPTGTQSRLQQDTFVA